MNCIPFSKFYSLLHTLFVLLLVFTFQCCKKDPGIAIPTIENSEELSGGDFTTFDVSPQAYGNAGLSLDGIGLDKFAVGNSFFRNNWVAAPSSTVARDGIGPMLNALSCSGCHFNDGRGRPPLNPGEKLSSMLIRLSTSAVESHGAPVGLIEYGEQLNNKSIPGATAEGDVLVNYIENLGKYDDGAEYSLRNPTYNFINLAYGAFPSDFLFSPRVAPQMPGLGLLEAIDEKSILANADPNDSNKDGISGRPNIVWDNEKNQNALGRFGWKANQPSISQQTAAAFVGDMGITSSLFPLEHLGKKQHLLYDSLPKGGKPEIEKNILDNVIFYSSTLSVPARRNWTEKQVVNGKSLFMKTGCGNCHIPSFVTGVHSFINELSNQKIMPYTDLLLHDMGPELADGRKDFEANGNEWRTPPLWGLGLLKKVSNHTFLLHDGRARNFEEAILWHGGEAIEAQKSFKKLDKLEREAMIKFIESL